jgi:hypothetical protein
VERLWKFFQTNLFYILLQKHTLFTYPYLTNFLDSWNVYMRLKCVPLIGLEWIPPIRWRRLRCNIWPWYQMHLMGNEKIQQTTYKENVLAIQAQKTWSLNLNFYPIITKQMNNWIIGKNNGCNRKWTYYSKENKQTLAHPFNFSLIYLSNNLNHRIWSRKQWSQGVFMEEEDVAMVAWTFDMQ